MHGSIEWPHGVYAQRVVLLLKPVQPGLVTLHLRLQLLEIQIVAISTIECEHLLGQGEQWFDPGAAIIRRERTRLPLLANSGRPKQHHLSRIVPVLAEEAGRRRKWIAENLLFQSGPHKTIDRL